MSGATSYWLFRIDWCPWLQDFLLNFSFLFVGILITVVLVETLQSHHEVQQWSKVSDLVSRYVARVGTQVISAYARAFQFTPERDALVSKAGGDEDALREAMIGLAENLLLTQTSNVVSMPQEAWQTLHKELINAHHEADRAITLFGGRMTPQIMGDLLQIQARLEAAASTIGVYQGVLGVPASSITEGREPPEVQLDRAHQVAAANATRALEAATVLLHDH